MTTIRSQGHWMVGLIGIICLIGSAVTLAQKDTAEKTGVADARDLSKMFRASVKQALPCVVSIETVGRDIEELLKNSPFGDRLRKELEKNPQRRLPPQRGTGSGFVIDPSGIILTNSHVVRDAQEVTVKMSDGREYSANPATDINFDSRSDVAIIRIHPEQPLQALRLGDSEKVEIADWVLAVGSPFGLELSVTAGIISAMSRGPGIAERENFLQTDAAINPGNSGGPLLNLDGEVIGINTAISSRSGGYDGVSFAIPINMARWVSSQLIEHGEVKRAFLGVIIQDVDNDLAGVLQTRVGGGALVNDVLPDSPAARAKMKTGDVILGINGKQIRGTRNLQGVVEQLQLDKPYPVDVLRDGKKTELKLSLAVMPDNPSTSRFPRQLAKKDVAKDVPSLGFKVDELAPETREALGHDAVIITEVTADGPAERTGLEPGLLIERIGKQPVKNLATVQAALKKAPKEGVLLLVRTFRGRRFLVVKPKKN